MLHRHHSPAVQVLANPLGFVLCVLKSFQTHLGLLLAGAIAYTQHVQTEPKKRGRPKLYGEKIRLRSLLNDNAQATQSAISPVYGEQNVTIQYRVCDLLSALRTTRTLRRGDSPPAGVLPANVH